MRETTSLSTAHRVRRHHGYQRPNLAHVERDRGENLQIGLQQGVSAEKTACTIEDTHTHIHTHTHTHTHTYTYRP
jgi:hypothetical protein